MRERERERERERDDEEEETLCDFGGALILCPEFKMQISETW